METQYQTLGSVSALNLQAVTGLLAVIVLLAIMNWFFHKIHWGGWMRHRLFWAMQRIAQWRQRT